MTNFTKKEQKILNTIVATKEINKKIEKETYYSAEHFINDAKRYIKAIKDDRMLCNVSSVAKSGMSRNLKFSSCERRNYDKGYQYANYNMLFIVLGFKKARNDNFSFVVSGCGMDMIFATNYSIIRNLYNLGFINLKECEILEQKTPACI